MRVLAVDVGDRRIGLAISDELGISGQPLSPLFNNADTWKKIISILERYDVQYIVIGLPYQLDGKLGPQAEKVKAWVDELRNFTDLTIEMVDERMTTRSAERMLIEGSVRRKKRKQVIDSLAAVLILQTFLDRRRKDERNDGIK